MDSGTLRNPLLEQQGGSTESIAGQVIQACTANYGRQRTIGRRRTFARLQSTRDGREQQPISASILSRVGTLILQVYNRFIQELTHFSLPAKAGLAGSLCSLLCFAPGVLSVFNKYGTWAVVTADLVLETNVGFTFRGGIGNTLGTLAAAALAVLVDFIAGFCGAYEPYFLVVSIFLSGSLATMFKLRPPFKDRWNTAVVFGLLIFHILILSKLDQKDKTMVPIILFSTIIIGFLTASLVNLSIAPKYAGMKINELVAKNLEMAGNVVERCVVAYCEGTELEEMHLSDNSDDVNMHTTFDEIISAGNEVDKLLKAVPFEPCRGKFFYGYPWDVYEDILHSLKHAVYDVVELDSCLHSEIQAPLHFRQLFEEEFMCIGKALAQVFRKLGESMREMKHMHSLDPMQEAEEGALLLQYNIAKQTSSLVSDRNGGIDIAGQDPDAHQSLDVVGENDTLSSEEPVTELSESSGSTKRRRRLADGHQDFLQRRETMNRNWDSTVQRIAALSLIKFSALLIELVVKAKYVVTLVDELEHKAHFKEDEEGNSRHPMPGDQQIDESSSLTAE